MSQAPMPSSVGDVGEGTMCKCAPPVPEDIGNQNMLDYKVFLVLYAYSD